MTNANVINQQKYLSYLVWASFFIFVFFRLIIPLFCLLFDQQTIIDILFDDAYYYLAVAFNLAHHGISSFDRITETNGYQPLWLAILALFDVLLQLGRKGFFIFTIVLIGVLTILPVLYLLRRKEQPLYLGLAVGLLASYCSYPFVWLLGLETVLLAPLFVLFAILIKEKGLMKSVTQCSLLFPLIILTRLDAVSLLVAYASLLFVLFYRQQGYVAAIKKTTLLVLPSLAVLLTYFAINKFVFDTFVPVSGAAKMIGAQAFSNWGIAYYYFFNMQYFLLPLFVLILAEIRGGKFQDAQFIYGGILLLLASSFIQYIYYAMFSGWIVWPWYFYQYALIMVLIMARLMHILHLLAINKLAHNVVIKRLIIGVIVIFITIIPVLLQGSMLGLLFYTHKQADNAGFTFNLRSMADLRSTLKTTESLTVMMGDRAGGLGYWAGDNIHVFQLEGLVANHDYLQARKNEKGKEWLAANIKPDYLLVDREVMPVMTMDDTLYYIVIEPIQGRVVFEHLLAFCFKEDAVVEHKQFTSAYPNLLIPDANRYIFDLSKEVPCEGKLAEKIKALVSDARSLRHFSLPIEYDDFWFNAKMEKLDRKLAFYLRKHWRTTL